MKFKQFAEFLNKIEGKSSRNEITIDIAEFLKLPTPEEVVPLMYLIQGQLYPTYKNKEFNFSRKLVQAAFQDYVDPQIGTNSKDLYKIKGDLGLVSEEIVSLANLAENESSRVSMFEVDLKFEDQNLDVLTVYKFLESLANLAGKGSQEGKAKEFIELISKLDPLSARYATRIILGALRLGVSDKTLLDSLSWFKVGNKSLREKLDGAMGAKSDIGYIAQLVIQSVDIEKDLENIKLEPGIPVASKLVEREKDSEKVWERMPNCFVQPKLDGLRGQIHKLENGLVKIFSRNMEDMTDQFPEITTMIKNLKPKSLILDSEIIGFDIQNKEYLSYQETMQRKRKYEIDKFALSIPVKAMCFDILYLDNKDLTQTPVEERIVLLKDLLKTESNPSKDHSYEVLEMLETKQMTSWQELDDYFQACVTSGLEGIITKEAESNYEPGTRNYKWIKLKANTQSSLVDTIDVVVLGYYYGRGKRAEFGLGALLTGVYNPEDEKYYSIGKVGTGFKDEDLKSIKSDLTRLELDSKPENVEVEKQLYPDVWVDPKIVIEIDADEITRSPSHTAARGIPAKVPKDQVSRGLSVRFPRIKVWNRDKDLPNTVQEIVKMYELRKS